jgi:hypothetical protein
MLAPVIIRAFLFINHLSLPMLRLTIHSQYNFTGN